MYGYYNSSEQSIAEEMAIINMLTVLNTPQIYQ